MKTLKRIFLLLMLLLAGSDTLLNAQTATLVKDINPGSAGSGLATNIPFVGYQSDNFAVMNGILYFTANDGVNGGELWRSDGTGAGTWMVKNINPAAGAEIHYITLGAGMLFFNAKNGTNAKQGGVGAEPWKSDGTAAGTALVKDINVGANDSWPRFFFPFGGYTYFSAYPTSHIVRGQGGIKVEVTDHEFYRSDGTTNGTVMVKDLNPGNVQGSWPGMFLSFQNKIFFVAYTNSNGYETWKSDGTAAGTSMLLDLFPGIGCGRDSVFSTPRMEITCRGWCTTGSSISPETTAPPAGHSGEPMEHRPALPW